MGAPTPSMPQNPTNPPMQQHSMDGKGGGKGMSGSGMATPPISRANSPAATGIANPLIERMATSSMDQGNFPAAMENGYLSTMPNKSTPQPQAGNGKGFAGNAPNPNAFTPDGGNMTISATSGQPQNGQPNPYANTIGSWDNQSNQQPQAHMGGKGKGA